METAVGLECSIVIPVQNAEKQIFCLHQRLTIVMQRLAIPYEIIYVDDGSTDRTAESIAQMREQDEAVKGVVLSRPFGHQAALSAGLTAATGRAVITMEGNLQDPPEVIPKLIAEWHRGYKVVFARPSLGKRNPIMRATRLLLGRLQQRLSKLSISIDTSDFALMDRQVVEQLKDLPERNRMIRGLRKWVGFEQITVKYDRHAWPMTAIPYTLSRLVRSSVNAIFAFSDAPLKSITLTGCVVTGLALSGFVFGSIGILRDAGRLGGMIWLGSTLAMLGGIHLICLGILGEYMSRVYREVRGRPLFVIRERLGFNDLPRLVPNVLDWLTERECRRSTRMTADRLIAGWTETPTDSRSQT
jgi:dolichol-phosphate mannosyltransferase